MNNSRRTTIIAQGIALWAVVMDQPTSPMNQEQIENEKAWLVWENDNPQFVEFVKREQFNLFDRVNAAF